MYEVAVDFVSWACLILVGRGLGDRCSFSGWLLCSGEFKNKWSCTSAPSVSLLGVEGENSSSYRMGGEIFRFTAVRAGAHNTAVL